MSVRRVRVDRLAEWSQGQRVRVQGWVRSVRRQKTIKFVSVNDGSDLKGVQVVMSGDVAAHKQLTTGASVSVEGVLVACPSSQHHAAFEIQADTVEVIGPCDETYPLQKKRHSTEFLRTIGHLRPRSNSFASVMRLRNTLAMSVHQYFQGEGFLQVHTPIITASDCEGGGKLFQVESPSDDSQDNSSFFGTNAYLTVSGQLHAEIMASALGSVYTFGPTFRAENSHTTRHLSEFWMVEPEIAFADLHDVMNHAESLIKHCIASALQACPHEMTLFDQHAKKGLLDSLTRVSADDFARTTYSEAINILQHSPRAFKFPTDWGCNLQSEHEIYLAESHFKRPVFVTHYPKSIKPFYMKPSGDGTTVAAVDLLVPGIGELVGGSERIDDYEQLMKVMKESGLDAENLEWYSDIRRFGSVPHAGFGLGFERLIQFVSGTANVRDVIAAPRAPRLCPL